MAGRRAADTHLGWIGGARSWLHGATPNNGVAPQLTTGFRPHYQRCGGCRGVCVARATRRATRAMLEQNRGCLGRAALFAPILSWRLSKKMLKARVGPCPCCITTSDMHVATARTRVPAVTTPLLPRVVGACVRACVRRFDLCVLAGRHRIDGTHLHVCETGAARLTQACIHTRPTQPLIRGTRKPHLPACTRGTKHGGTRWSAATPPPHYTDPSHRPAWRRWPQR